jgi:hypothetical protein
LLDEAVYRADTLGGPEGETVEAEGSPLRNDLERAARAVEPRLAVQGAVEHAAGARTLAGSGSSYVALPHRREAEAATHPRGGKSDRQGTIDAGVDRGNEISARTTALLWHPTSSSSFLCFCACAAALLDQDPMWVARWQEGGIRTGRILGAVERLAVVRWLLLYSPRGEQRTRRRDTAPTTPTTISAAEVCGVPHWQGRVSRNSPTTGRQRPGHDHNPPALRVVRWSQRHRPDVTGDG